MACFHMIARWAVQLSAFGHSMAQASTMTSILAASGFGFTGVGEEITLLSCEADDTHP